MKSFRLILISSLALLLLVSASQACPIPVFRYALERWQAHPYDIVVFHRGPLSTDESKMLATLGESGYDAKCEANFTVRDVDLAGQPAEKDNKLWQNQKTQSLPWIVVNSSEGAPDQQLTAWAGKFEPKAIREFLDSPARRQIVRQLAAGDSAVWLLIEKGDKATDDSLALEMTKEFAKAKEEIQLSEEARQASSQGGPELKISFSLIRLSRKDPAESAFVNMLLNLLGESGKTQDAIAIPVFGRGRALTAMSGKDIKAEYIRQCEEFLSGSCACTIKEENPGVDLLISADWEQILSDGKVNDPHLASFAELTKLSPATSTAPAEKSSAASQTENLDNRTIYRNVIITVVGALLVIVILTLILARRKKPAE